MKHEQYLMVKLFCILFILPHILQKILGAAVAQEVKRSSPKHRVGGLIHTLVNISTCPCPVSENTNISVGELVRFTDVLSFSHLHHFTNPLVDRSTTAPPSRISSLNVSLG